MFSTRLESFLAHIGISATAFEPLIGVSKGTIYKPIKNGKTVGVEVLEKIISKYPNLSLEWLVGGVGEMLKSNTISSQGNKNVHLISTPNSTPNSKSKDLGVQKLEEPAVVYSENLSVQIVDVRAAANLQWLSMHEGHIDTLGTIPVPKTLLGRNSRKKHFWFPVVGDSMEPTIYVGDYILASLIEPQEYDTIKDNYLYIISTTNGIVIKRVLNRLDSRGQLYAKSDNRAYSSFNIDQEDIVSIWFAQARMSFKFPNEQIDLFNAYKDLESRIETLERKK